MARKQHWEEYRIMHKQVCVKITAENILDVIEDMKACECYFVRLGGWHGSKAEFAKTCFIFGNAEQDHYDLVEIGDWIVQDTQYWNVFHRLTEEEFARTHQANLPPHKWTTPRATVSQSNS